MMAFRLVGAAWREAFVSLSKIFFANDVNMTLPFSMLACSCSDCMPFFGGLHDGVHRCGVQGGMLARFAFVVRAKGLGQIAIHQACLPAS